MTGTYDETTGMITMTFAEYSGMVKDILEGIQRLTLAKKEASELEVTRVTLTQEIQMLRDLVIEHQLNYEELLHPCPVCDPAYHEALEEE